MAAILETDHLTMTYHVGKVDVPALRGVNLSVAAGEFISVMGPSGCGKSTLLHILGGLLKPTSGRVIVDGEELAAVGDGARSSIRRRKAKGSRPLPEQIHGTHSRGDEGRRREVLRLLRLEGKMRHKPLELS